MGTYLNLSTLLDEHFGYLYLHVPDNEEWPDSQWLPDDRVATNRYSRITRVSHVSQEQYEQDLHQGKVLFHEKHGASEYYATERAAEAENIQRPVSSIVLERKAHP